LLNSIPETIQVTKGRK